MKNKTFGQWLTVIIVFPLALILLLLVKIIFCILLMLLAAYYGAHIPLYEQDSDEEKYARENMMEWLNL